jgi:hypothetical protein
MRRVGVDINDPIAVGAWVLNQSKPSLPMAEAVADEVRGSPIATKSENGNLWPAQKAVKKVIDMLDEKMKVARNYSKPKRIKQAISISQALAQRWDCSGPTITRIRNDGYDPTCATQLAKWLLAKPRPNMRVIDAALDGMHDLIEDCKNKIAAKQASNHELESLYTLTGSLIQKKRHAVRYPKTKKL